MKVKVKALNALFSIICVLIFPSEADIQENALCAECKRSTLPQCENDIKSDNVIHCKEAGCAIALVADGETDMMCILDTYSAENQSPQSSHIIETTVLPVPLALQIVTTTETTKEVEANEGEVEKPEDTAEQNTPNEVTIEEKEAQQEPSTDNTETFSENGNEPNPAGEEQNPQETEEGTNDNTEIEESKPEIADVEDVAQNVDQNESEEAVTEGKENQQDHEPKETSAEEVADANENTEPVATEAGEVEDTESSPAITAPEGNSDSPDYPADAPAMSEDKEEEVMDKLPSKPTSNEALDKDKEEDSTGNSQQNTMSSAETEVTNNNDKPEYMSGHEAENHPDSGVMPNAGSVGATTATNTLAPTLPQQVLTCYSCTSTEDMKCSVGPGKPIHCQAMENKPNGCYTLYKADTNITTRGCISELTDSGLKYCQSNKKQCILCHEKSCNNLLAPSAATQSTPVINLSLGIVSFMCLKYLL